MIERWLKKVKSGYISDQEVQFLVYEAHKMSLAYLKIRVKRDDYILELMGGSYDDLAWDCVSELFVRDENGRFTNIRDCLHDYGADNSDQKNVSAFRRMVFTKTNDTIFTLLGRYDSSLSKIIRNIKLAAADHPNTSIQAFGNDNHVVFDGKETACGFVEPDFLLTGLISSLSSNSKSSGINTNIRDLLAETVTFFAQNSEGGNSISVVQLAYIFRKLFVKLHGETPPSTDSPDRNLNAQERKRLLKMAVLSVTNTLKTTYVTCDKLTEPEFLKLMVVAEQIVHNRFVTRDSEKGYFEFYSDTFITVSKSAYRQGHRSVLEYIVQKVEKKFLHLFEKDLTV